MERKLVIKAMAITFAFLFTYSLKLCCYIYEMVTKTYVHPISDAVAACAICFNALLNSFVLLSFDGLIQSSALEMFGLKSWFARRRRTHLDKGVEQIALEKQERQEKVDEIDGKDNDMPPSKLIKSVATPTEHIMSTPTILLKDLRRPNQQSD